jgi:hypothetical protein
LGIAFVPGPAPAPTPPLPPPPIPPIPPGRFWFCTDCAAPPPPPEYQDVEPTTIEKSKRREE